MTQTKELVPGIATSSEILDHWQGHRRLTRKVIEAFPEDAFFNYSIGAMRPFSEMIKELLSIAAPGIREIVTGNQAPYDENLKPGDTKADFLKKWDEATQEINSLWKQIPATRFHETIKAFGMYEGTVLSSIQYYVDNEIHHRGQGYVYLRGLGIEPPAFYDRS